MTIRPMFHGRLKAKFSVADFVRIPRSHELGYAGNPLACGLPLNDFSIHAFFRFIG